MHKGYMIFSTALALFSLTMTSVGGLATSADGFASLEKRAVANLVTQVDRPNTFYRAITGPEKAYLASSYPEGGHPNIWRRTEGDFSATGAFYAFHVSRRMTTLHHVWICDAVVLIFHFVYIGATSRRELGRRRAA